MKYVATAALALTLSVLNAAQPQPPQPREIRAPQGAAQSAATAGRIRVLVRLDVPAAPEATLPPAAVALQRDRFARAAERVLSGPAGRHVLKSRRFDTIPYAAMEVDATGLADLAAQPDVESVVPDVAEPITLAQSTVLVQSTLTTAAGRTGSGWNVAVLDTGIEGTHAFFGGRVTYEHCYSTTFSGFSSSLCPDGTDEQAGPGSAAPCVAMSGCDHGTHVAGIAAGSNGSAGGALFSGAAPAAGILAFQVFSRISDITVCGDAGTVAPCILSFNSDQMLALERVYALRSTHNIAAINMSLGGGRYTTTAQCDLDNHGRKLLIDNLRAAGIATVISSGNSAWTDAISAPGCISTAVSVGSTTDGSSPVVSDFSNSASFLSLLAPGQVITSSITSNGFGGKSGTSMAAPHVAGAWAVAKSAMPGASVDTVLTALQDTGRPITDARNGLVKPLIQVNDALGALFASCTYAINPGAVTIGPGADSGGIQITAPPGCPWTAASHDAFLTLDSATSGSGSSTVDFSVTANPMTTPRSGTATIAGQTFAVTQMGSPAPCSYAINPSAISVGSVGDSGTIFVTTEPGCAWSVTSHASFLTVPGDARSGSGGVAFSLVTNYSSMPRTGTATVAGLTFTATQAGTPLSPGTRARERARSDFDGDGHADLLWQDLSGGNLLVWTLQNHAITGAEALSHRVNDTTWRIVGTGDFNADGKPDLLWHHATEGWLYLWYMDGVTRIGSTYLSVNRMDDTRWIVAGLGDFNADGTPDIVWQHTTAGWLVVWYLDGATVTGGVEMSPLQLLDPRWRIAGVADFNADGQSDLLWRHGVSGELGVWLMDGVTRSAYVPLDPGVADTDWRIAAVTDLNDDDTPDLVWHHDTHGWVVVWSMNGTVRTVGQSLPGSMAPQWRLVGPR